MKNPKIILCLGLLLIGLLPGCSTTTSGSTAGTVSPQGGVITCAYELDTKTFFANFEKRTNLTKMIDDERARHAGGSINSVTVGQQALRNLLAQKGVKLQPPSLIFLNDRLGLALVRGTITEQKAVVRVLADLNGGPVRKRPNPSGKP